MLKLLNMHRSNIFSIVLFAAAAAVPGVSQIPHAIDGGYELPNGWRITPAGRSVETEDMLLKAITAPDGRVVIAVESGYNPHGLVVVDTATHRVSQRIPLKSTWLGMAWSLDGKKLYVSGGNAQSKKNPTKAPVYEFGYRDGRLDSEPSGSFEESIDLKRIFWAGLAPHPNKNLLYAANRDTINTPGYVAVFDTNNRTLVTRIPVETSPYELVFAPDGRHLYVSNWSSKSVSVIDTDSNRVVASIAVGANPNDMKMLPDGRLFVACSNDNSVYVIDTRKGQVIERIATTVYPQAPEGSTPDALAVDAKRKLLYVANADHNSVAVARIETPGKSQVIGFIPTGWYPSALTMSLNGDELYIGNSKGAGSYSDVRGPHSPLPPGPEGNGSIKSLQKGSMESVDLTKLSDELPKYTKQVIANSPYNSDDLLSEAKAAAVDSIIPRRVGAGSPIEHVIYIIKENRTYDQVLGDLPKGNGDARLAIFGRKVTPNHHALSEQFVTLDNLYCDGEVSVDGHSWTNSAYATDLNEKLWPVSYGGHGGGAPSAGYIPSAGHIWDLCRRKGLTYRSYGEYAARSSDGTAMQAAPGVDALWGHVSKDYRKPGQRDPQNVDVFIKEFDEYESQFDNPDPEKRLPNYIVMSLGEDHTVGTTPGLPTPVAAVGSNDFALGKLVERVSHSKYWPKTAIFVIEDDAQDGADHVDAHRTVGLAISPYVRRGKVDSTQYTTSSMVRSIELLLGLPPMSQYDAAATPMYGTLGTAADLTPYNCIDPVVNLSEKNTEHSYGAKLSRAMDFSDYDEAPMEALNEIVWKSVMGPDSKMPAPVHRYRALVDAK